jgi:hypothetical protein
MKPLGWAVGEIHGEVEGNTRNCLVTIQHSLTT